MHPFIYQRGQSEAVKQLHFHCKSSQSASHPPPAGCCLLRPYRLPHSPRILNSHVSPSASPVCLSGPGVPDQHCHRVSFLHRHRLLHSAGSARPCTPRTNSARVSKLTTSSTQCTKALEHTTLRRDGGGNKATRGRNTGRVRKRTMRAKRLTLLEHCSCHHYHCYTVRNMGEGRREGKEKDRQRHGQLR